MRSLRSACFLFLCASCLALSGGCDDTEPLPPMAAVSGKAMVGDTPLTGGHVSLHPISADQKLPGLAAGEIDASGNYTIHTAGQTGAPLGKYKVTVNPSMVPPGGDKMPSAPFNAMYSDANKTPLTIDVVENPKAGAYDLELKK